MRPIIIALTFFLAGASSCDRPECKNKNATFDKFLPGTKEYNDELVKQMEIAGANNISYWLDKYFQRDGQEYLSVNIRAKNLCATGIILVTDWNRLQTIRRTMGKGYSGAQLVGLTFDIRKDLTTTNFYFKDIDYIMD